MIRMEELIGDPPKAGLCVEVRDFGSRAENGGHEPASTHTMN